MITNPSRHKHEKSVSERTSAGSSSSKKGVAKRKPKRPKYGDRSQFWGVILDTLEALDCAEALSVAIMVRHGDFRQAILHSDIDPLMYNSSETFRKAYQSRKLISKLDLDIGVDREGAARTAFWKSEESCGRVNGRFQRYWNGDTSVFSPATMDILSKAQKIISKILGPCPDPSVLLPRFGPGATFSRRGHSSTLIDKIGEVAPSMTHDVGPLLGFLPPVLLESYIGRPLFGDEGSTVNLKVTEVLGSEYITVPKNAKTFRGICIEPSLNSFWQLGYGGYIRQRLKKRGLNLDRQAEFNGHYAQIGSRSGYYATIDLEGASDSVAFNLIYDLLPIDWAEALHSCRSPRVKIDGKWHELEKWSSMGNGYTFELETLIFYSICLAVSEDSRVFGDDIIVPSDDSSTVIAALSDIGFTVNREKTFLSGPFRESCGQDFFLGVAVRPLFIKELPNGSVERVFGLANVVREIASRSYNGCGCNIQFRRPWLRVVHWLPSHLRLYGPRWLGDIVLHDVDERWHAIAKIQCGISRIKVWAPRVIRKNIKRYHPEAQLAYALYGGSPSGSERRGMVDYRIKTKTVVLTYDEGAAWC